MRIHRFFVEQNLNNSKKVSVEDKDLLHQWRDVFRLKAGDNVILLDNSGDEFHGTFDLVSRERAEFTITEIKKALNIPQKKLKFFAALIKKDKFEWVIEKATEIGVSEIIPVISERSEKKNLNMERAHKILKEASEQSHRGTLPVLHEPVSLEDALHSLDIPGVSFHLEGERFNVKQHVTQNEIAVFIGPEGGWSDKELMLFKDKSIPLYSLGHQVLKAETATVAVGSLIMFS